MTTEPYQEVVINRSFGGFGLSVKAVRKFLELKGKNLYLYDSDLMGAYRKINKEPEACSYLHFFTKDYGEVVDSGEVDSKDILDIEKIRRTDPALIQVVKELGREANGPFAFLKIVEVPLFVDWKIIEVDGLEYVAEKRRIWY